MSESFPYVDAHCHLADLRYEAHAGQLDEVLQRSESQGIGMWIQGGVDSADWERQKSLKKKFPKKILTSFGLHPWWVARASESEFLSSLKVLEKELPGADALGEIGLDYGPKIEPKSADGAKAFREFQKKAFRDQLELLKIIKKPLVLHIVRAHEDAALILKEYGPFAQEGIVHSFSGNRESARKYLDLGLSLSLSGGITRKGFESLKRAVTYIPIDRLLVETDSPDQAIGDQVSEEKTLNEPSALIEIANAVASFRKTTRDEILRESARNALRIFRGNHA
jgi:TatD DNase family protein